MTTATKWALAAGVLALAVLVALLPRTGSDGGTAPAEDLGPARERAALQPCPSGGGGRIEALAGVEATCLGDGSAVDVGSALAGRPSLVNVWATWCEPCREELPLLQSYAARPDAVRVLTVQVESSARDGLDLLAELGVHLPAIHDGEGASGPVRTALRVPRALPASYVVTADGSVSLVRDPRLFTSVGQIRDAVSQALGTAR